MRTFTMLWVAMSSSSSSRICLICYICYLTWIFLCGYKRRLFLWCSGANFVVMMLMFVVWHILTSCLTFHFFILSKNYLRVCWWGRGRRRWWAWSIFDNDIVTVRRPVTILLTIEIIISVVVALFLFMCNSCIKVFS